MVNLFCKSLKTFVLFGPTLVLGLLEEKFIALSAGNETSSGINIAHATIIVDATDFRGVQIAAESLADDFGRVTGNRARIINYSSSNSSDRINYSVAIIAGSLTESGLIQKIIKEKHLDVTKIEGKWESFLTAIVDEPISGIKKALVIVGSDKRGSIYGIYTISEQIGVSPWYWWADVVPKKHKDIHALDMTTYHGEPSVKFRGIFINDEAPALNSWVLEKFGSKYNVNFYKHVFELLLRMKANYLWPAMWPAYPEPGNSFFVDDPLNQATADDYGIVVSTSHHEPMQRATNEWLTSGQGSWDWEKNKEKIYKFFEGGAERAKDYESYFTMGMRGDSDSGLSGDNPMAIMRDVIDSQREIITKVYGNATAVRQVWALYKEVLALYEQGLEVPDDITLLFADDNFGNIRRLPTKEELKRAGGTGIYYHIEYVGVPRSYKWLNTNSLDKIWNQLNTAWIRGVDQIWVINVADIKPMEVPLSLIMEMAWNSSSVTVPKFLNTYSEREFNSKHSSEIAALLSKQSFLLGLRKHENIEAETFSVVNYEEADRILESWKELADSATDIYEKLSDDLKPGFFQIVLHPIKATYIYLDVRVSQGKNRLFGTQRRNSANTLAQHVLKRFDEDYDLEEEYHSLLDGKWNHIMDQAHYGYTSTWYAPSRDMITGLSYVQSRQSSVPAIGQLGISVEGNTGVRPGLWNEGSDLAKPSRDDLVPGVRLPPMDPYGPEARYIDLFCRGNPAEIRWTINTQYDWIKTSPSSGVLRNGDQKISIAVDWAAVPKNFDQTALVYVNSTIGDYEEVRLPINNTQIPAGFKGFVESDKYVSMEAAHFTSSSGTNLAGSYYKVLSQSGSRTSSGTVALYPVSDYGQQAIPNSPFLTYDFHLFSTVSQLNVSLYFTMALDTDSESPLTYGISLDNAVPANTTRLLEAPAKAGDLPSGWDDAARDGVWRRSHKFDNLGPGKHTITYWAGRPGLMLERVLVDLGGVRSSYLGPPESKNLT
ncbi:hypothetical protein EDC01DRAFT_742895 [Geopyxis carbonaria]|nr:hypothetical protein EDC01DRAFT_742895 [Geopyxis carbonaria]